MKVAALLAFLKCLVLSRLSLAPPLSPLSDSPGLPGTTPMRLIGYCCSVSLEVTDSEPRTFAEPALVVLKITASLPPATEWVLGLASDSRICLRQLLLRRRRLMCVVSEFVAMLKDSS
jgi:hypothetical protein